MSVLQWKIPGRATFDVCWHFPWAQVLCCCGWAACFVDLVARRGKTLEMGYVHMGEVAPHIMIVKNAFPFRTLPELHERK